MGWSICAYSRAWLPITTGRWAGVARPGWWRTSARCVSAQKSRGSPPHDPRKPRALPPRTRRSSSDQQQPLSVVFRDWVRRSRFSVLFRPPEPGQGPAASEPPCQQPHPAPLPPRLAAAATAPRLAAKHLMTTMVGKRGASLKYVPMLIHILAQES